VFVFSGVMAMAGLGAAFIFVPLFYYMGVPLAEATSTALLLNVVSLLFAAVNYQRGGLINWRVGFPILIAAVVLAPLGARVTPLVNKTILLAMFAGFLLFAGFMMLFYRAAPKARSMSYPAEVGLGSAVGAVAGFLGGLLGVGGGNFIVPVLNWIGLDAKIAAGTTAMVAVFASFSGFLGHVALGGLNPAFVGLMALMVALGSIAGSHLMKTRLSSAQLKRIIGVLLWLIAAKMLFDLIK
jgi:uncharacterized membrane protein YfcA